MELLKKVVNSLDDVRTKNIVIYDMKGISPLFDYLILATASSNRQVTASVSHLKNDLKDIENIVQRVEGANEGKWVLIDLGEIIVNVLLEEEREYYNLDKIWVDVPKINASTLIDNGL